MNHHTIIVSRHGLCEKNHREKDGLGPSLCEEGRGQVNNLGERIKGVIGEAKIEIISSLAKRTVESGNILYQVLDGGSGLVKLQNNESVSKYIYLESLRSNGFVDWSGYFGRFLFGGLNDASFDPEVILLSGHAEHGNGMIEFLQKMGIDVSSITGLDFGEALVYRKNSNDLIKI